MKNFSNIWGLKKINVFQVTDYNATLMEDYYETLKVYVVYKHQQYR